MDLKKAFGSLVLIGAMLGCSLASATDIKDFPRVAVMNIGNKAITSRGLRQQDMSSATEYAIYQLSASGWFDLIDYEQLGTIANMHSINMSGMVDTATAVEMGKIAGAEYMVVGYVTGLTTKENTAFIQGFNAKGGNSQHVVTANVALRIVDIKTGRIMVAGLGKGSSTSTLTEIGFTKYRNRRNVVSENIYNSTLNNVVNEINKKNGSSYANSSSSDSSDRNMTDSSSSQYNKNTYDSSRETYNKNSSMTSGSSFTRDTVEWENANAYTYSKSMNETYKYKKLGNKVKIQSIECDVNEDGQIDWTDVKAVENYCIDDNPRISNFNKNNADMNGDGKITIEDAWKLKMLVYGLNQKTYKHVIGDIDSEEENGRVDANDENVLKNYLVGNKPSYINIIEADLNGDDNITLTDLSILKSRSNNVGCTKTSWMIYSSIPQKYIDYNKNHGIYVEQGSSGTVDIDKVMSEHSTQCGYDKHRYFGTSGRTLSWAREEVSEVRTYDRQTCINESSSSDRVLHDSTNKASNSSNSSGYADEASRQANNSTNFSSNNQYVTYEREAMDYKIVIGTVEVSDVQVRNAISKAVRDAVYGDMGILTTLNNGKKLKIKTGF